MAAHLHLAPSQSDTGNVLVGNAPIRVVLADGHALMRRSLRLLLDAEQDLEVIAEASDIPAVMRHVQNHQPDVLVLDLNIPNGSSIETIGLLRKRSPATQIVILTMEESPVFAMRVLDAGAIAYLAKELADRELPQAVRAAVDGERYVSPQLATRVDALERSLNQDRLTAREVEVLRLVALGYTNIEIARQLKLSPRTVQSLRADLHKKLLLRTRAELVKYALGRGLLRA
jgi:two-component system, NarL family, response regulator NreC